MKPLVTHVLSSLVFGLALSATSAHAAEPKENPSATLTRTAQMNELKTSLSKNFYKQVPYEAEYTVAIPYQTEETYTDYEDQTSSEYQCHTVTDYQQECHNENQCYTVPGNTACRQECGNGSINPRTGQQEPSGCQQVCETGPSQQQCSSQQVCSNNPVSRQECGYETVHRSVPVQRTRTVTAYRYETRCCETRYRTEFDYHTDLNVTITLPAEAVLDAKEKETFKVAMKTKSEVTITFGTNVYAYKIAEQTLSGSDLSVKLALAPKYTLADIGDKTITSIAMNVSAKGSSVTFQDSGLKARVNTSYQVSVFEKYNSNLLEKSDVVVSNGAKKVTVALKQVYSTDPEYLVRISVQREGVILVNALQFSKDYTRNGKPFKAELFDGRVVAIPKIQGLGRAAHIVFKDGAPVTLEVSNAYSIKVTVPTGLKKPTTKVLVEKTLDPADAIRSGALILDVPMTKLGVSEADLDANIAAGKKVTVDVTVVRLGSRLNGGKKLTIKRSYTGTLVAPPAPKPAPAAPAKN